jgi:nitroreductase
MFSGPAFRGIVPSVETQCRDGSRVSPIEIFYLVHLYLVHPGEFCFDPGKSDCDDEGMIKSAPAQYPILEVLGNRWSPLSFSGRKVEEDKLHRIFESARWAASCGNEQPWNYLVTHKGTEAFDKLADCLVEGNSWAKNAPILILVIARTIFSQNLKPNRHGYYDTGMATGNLLAQATAEGLVAHQMAGYDAARADAAFELPAHHESISVMALGYYGDQLELNEKQKEREAKPRVRKPAEDFVFDSDFSKTVAQ